MGGCGERQPSAVLRASALSICSTSTSCSVARSASVRLTLAILLTDLADKPSASADCTNRDLAAGEREERASFFFAFKRSVRNALAFQAWTASPPGGYPPRKASMRQLARRPPEGQYDLELGQKPAVDSAQFFVGHRNRVCRFLANRRGRDSWRRSAETLRDRSLGSALG